MGILLLIFQQIPYSQQQHPKLAFSSNKALREFDSCNVYRAGMARVFIAIILILLGFSLHAQYNDAETYTDPTEFELGDNIVLNQPSNGEKYRSVSYTFRSAKNLMPDIEEESYDKVYLSGQFNRAQFTIEEIDSVKALLSYGDISNFAYLDLEMAIKTGEVGDRSKMIHKWDASLISKNDLVLLKQVEKERYQSLWFHPTFIRIVTESNESDRIYLPVDYHGNLLRINKSRKRMATLGNDSSEVFAIGNLKLGLELNEIEILNGNAIQQSGNGYLADSLFVADTVQKVSIFSKSGIYPYVFPLVELSPESMSSFAFGGGVGVIIGQKWQAGAYIQKYEGGFTDTVVFPNSFLLDYSYGGIYGAYHIFQKGSLRVLAEVKLGMGEAAWSLEENGEVLDTDDFLVINPRIGIEYPLLGFSLLNLSLGYRAMNGLDLVELDSNSLSSFTFSLALKMGWFR